MAPSAATVQSLSKVKRPIPPGIVTNGINSSTSSPSPSMSASRLPGSGTKPPLGSATSNGVGSSTSGARSANRNRREAPGQLLGRGQRNSSVGLRSASIAGEVAIPQVAGPQPYIKTDEYILKKYRGHSPSLIIHLHPGHFRFDQQEGSFSYKSPMKLMIEHLRLRTIPHDLAEFFSTSNVPFYEGCMIVQVYDHKSTAVSQQSNRNKTGAGKTALFSIHKYNAYLTPSPYVPYPTESEPGKSRIQANGDSDESNKLKSAEQKDKENMPAPSFPVDGQRGRSSAQPMQPKVLTVVLHPTPVSNQADLVIKAAESLSGSVDGRDSRPDANAVPLSATVPPTPITGVPSTPLTSMAPPAKRLKRSKPELDSSNYHAVESQITYAINAPLILDPVNSAVESAALLDSLSHPMHSEKPPSPKTRKRTIAELAADEAQAAEQEQFMLSTDERLSAMGSQGGANPANGDGQAGGASFEPRFEKFKTLENIRNQHEDNKKAEKARQQEAERKTHQDRERERLRLEAEKREREKMTQQQMAQQAANTQNEANRQRAAMAARAQQQQQGMQGIQVVSSQSQGQHAHPQPTSAMPGGIQGQSQRFHQQQQSQAQISSPIVRNNTPQNLQNHSSPMANNPMQQSTSSMGGSPPRPGSVVHQNHPQMGGPTSHGMATQRSQQSHAGTPRMHSATPNIQSTPINRPMSQTPRMSQASPLQGQMAPVPAQMMTGNNQMVNIDQQRALQARIMQQRQLQQMQQHNQAMQAMVGMNGQPLNQQQFIQQQMMRAQQQGNQIPNNAQLSQNYAAQLAAMGQRPGGIPANMNMNMNMNGNGGMNMQQMQQLQQMQQMQAHQQAQVQAQVQAQAQAHAQAQAQQQPSNNAQMMQQQMINTIRNHSNALFQTQYQQIQQQYPNGAVPDDVARNLRMQCEQNARNSVQQRMLRQRAMVAQNGMPPNGMQNGMGMQRPQGM